MSTTKQRQQIGYMRKLLSLDDDTYREVLAQYNGAKSSKDLSVFDANCLLNNLRDKAREIGTFKPKKSTTLKQYKYNTLGWRSGMATPAQLRKIEAMWSDISFITDKKARQKALNTLVKRVTGKDSIMFITHKDVSKVIEALKAMGKDKKNA